MPRRSSAISTMDKSKRQKTNRECVSSCKNLCDMPDEILHRIMYFLPIRDIVQTGMLSTRWKNLWMSIPDLKFEEDDTIDRTTFMKLVELFLLLHDQVSTRTLCIDCDVCHDESRINTWITSALRCNNIRSISMVLTETEDEYLLPYSIFRCATITELTIEVDCVLHLPASTCLPSLKVLVLRFVRFIDRNTFEKLFSGSCLEELSIDSCSWQDLGEVNISAPNLCSLSIEEDENDHYELDANNQLIIHGPSLTTFYYSGPLLYHVDLFDLSSLDEATIDCNPETVYSDEITGKISRNVYDLLVDVIMVKRLNLSARALQVLVDKSLPGIVLCDFINLTTLKLISDPTKFNFIAFRILLWRTPFLSTLRFDKGITMDEDTCNTTEDQGLPPCLAYSIQDITVCNFGASGVTKELCAIKFLLSKTHELKTMVIHCERLPFRSWSMMKKEMLHHIRQLARRSNSRVRIEMF